MARGDRPDIGIGPRSLVRHRVESVSFVTNRTPHDTGGTMSSLMRTRWAAIGAAVAITFGAGGLGIVSAAIGYGERTVYVPIVPCRVLDTRSARAGTTNTTQCR